MAVNKVIYNGETLVDLTADTAAPENTLAGVMGHRANGEAFTGTIPKVAGGTITPGTEEQLVVSGGSYVMNDILVEAASGGMTEVEFTTTSYTRNLSIPWPKDTLPTYFIVKAADEAYENSGTTKELFLGIWMPLGNGTAWFMGISRRLAMAGLEGWYYYALAPTSSSEQMPTSECTLTDGNLNFNILYGYAGKRKYIVKGIYAD